MTDHLPITGPTAAQPLMLPTAIPPMPVPTAFATLQLPDGRGGFMLCLQIQQPTGVTVVFVSPEEAIKLGDDIRAAGTRAKLGLVVPGR